MKSTRMKCIAGIFAQVLLVAAANGRADIVTDWNAKAAEIASKAPAPGPAVRAMAMTQVGGAMGKQTGELAAKTLFK